MRFDNLKKDYAKRKAAGNKLCQNRSKFVKRNDVVSLFHAVIKSGDRVCLEGNNQKQADFLARELLKIDKRKIRGLHLVQSSVVLPEHIELFETGIAKNLDFSYSGPQSKKLYDLVASKKVQIGAIHTYLELYGRYFLDLFPKVSLVAADACDEKGNLFTGFNTEETPTICEATKVKHGIVIAQVKDKLRELPRVDIPGDWVDYIVVTKKDYFIEPLFTKDPERITELQILMAMMVIKGIYQRYRIKILNHGIGYPTAAVELILPTYGTELGLKGKCCTHWVLNPHPMLIPAIEGGFVKHIYSFGSEPGMEDYIRARSDIFCVGPDGAMRSSRCNAHIAGLYGIDLFLGATLQIDKYGNSSTAIKGAIAGFGGAPNLGSTPPGRRHITDSFKMAGYKANNIFYGTKLVVQVTPTISEKKQIPVFVNELFATRLHEEGLFDAPPVMITGDQITHIVTEQGIAYLDKCRDLKMRKKAIAAVAGKTTVGESIRKNEAEKLRKAGIFQNAEDLGIDRSRANRSLLAAKSLDDLVTISKGLYKIPEELRK